VESDERIVRSTAEELDRMLQQGEDRTEWARVRALTEEEVEASIDHEEEGALDWRDVQAGIPGPKQQLTVRFDVEVVKWFKAQAPRQAGRRA